MPLNHFRTVTTVRSDLFLAARAWIYFEPEPPFSLLLIVLEDGGQWEGEFAIDIEPIHAVQNDTLAVT